MFELSFTKGKPGAVEKNWRDAKKKNFSSFPTIPICGRYIFPYAYQCVGNVFKDNMNFLFFEKGRELIGREEEEGAEALIYFFIIIDFFI